MQADLEEDLGADRYLLWHNLLKLRIVIQLSTSAGLIGLTAPGAISGESATAPLSSLPRQTVTVPDAAEVESAVVINMVQGITVLPEPESAWAVPEFSQGEMPQLLETGGHSKVNAVASPCKTIAPCALEQEEGAISQRKEKAANPEKSQRLAPIDEASPPLPSKIETELLAQEENQEENIDRLASSPLFEQVFGATAPIQSAILPWSINGDSQGDLPVRIDSANDDIHWPAAGFLQMLAEPLQDQWLGKITALVENGFLSRRDLSQAGIQTEFDRRTLQLAVKLLPEQLRSNVVTFKKAQRSENTPTVNAARLSGYLNTRGSLGWTWLPENNNDAGVQPVALQWDGAVNYQGWVLEGQTRFLEDSETPWQRGDLRLVHDRPNLAMRFRAGEISSPTTGYQRGTSILGVSATRQFGLQPDRVTRPVSNYEFFLEEPSKVEVFINGDRERTLNLPAGNQDLRDFSLGNGINDVELLITDTVGRERRLAFFAPVTAQLLAPGLQQFAYSLGAPIEKVGGARSYHFGDTLLTASHRWGVTQTLTAGTYLQANTRQQMLGTDGVLATALGSWDWNTAMSLDPDAGIGYGARLGYGYRRSGDVQNKSLRLGLEYRSDRFLGVGEAEPNNSTPLEASLTYQQKLLGQINTNLAGRYQWTDEGNAYRVSLDLNRPVGNGRRFGVKFSYAQKADGQTDQQARMNFQWSMPQRRQTLTTSTETNLAGDVRQRTSWNYRDRASINAFNTGFNFSNDGETWDLAHRLNWRGYRATLGLKTDATGDRGSRLDWSGMESQLSFGTSLVFADGRFGWSKPVDGSFALFVPHKKLQGLGIEVNPSPNRAAAVIDRWGGAVLPGLSDYQINKINLDAPSLPLGYSLGHSSHRLKPGYRRGTLVTVGNDATVFLRGILQWADGSVSELKVGEVISLDDPSWKVKTIFTNRVGKFALENFKPGDYQIRLTDGETVIFSIPEDASGIYNIGSLQLESTGEDSSVGSGASLGG